MILQVPGMNQIYRYLEAEVFTWHILGDRRTFPNLAPLS